MYQTYKTEQPTIKKEEKLIPREVLEKKEKEEKTTCKNKLFDSLENEDILILGLLLILFFEDCKDNMLLLVLIALLFVK